MVSGCGIWKRETKIDKLNPHGTKTRQYNMYFELPGDTR